MDKLSALWLVIAIASRCNGIPTEEEILSAIDRATLQNTLKRGVASLMATDQEPQVNSCPHMARNFHGKRSSTDKKGDKRANDLIAAAQLLLKEGHSINDLQQDEVKRIFQRQSTNCPAQPTCTSSTVNTYRTADGSCNNVASPWWGQAKQPQIRIVSAAYDDAISTPRDKSVLGGDLPNPRTISNEVHAAPLGPEIRADTLTLHSYQMGQFLDHDVIATPAQSTISDCCSSEGKADTGNCYPIIVPGDDERFGSNNYCMNFQRSAPIFCPSVSPQREQLNAITSFVDASNVYGSSDDEMKTLREADGAGALLKTENGGDRLPNNPNNDACRSNPDDGVYCSMAGDKRVNVVPSLLAYHTLFVREHNRIAKVLQQFYSNNENETIFQEARKILIGVMQKIVYDEFLPAFLSPVAMETYNLSSTNAYRYNPRMNPTISNGFGIAFRFGHTWIPRNTDVFRKDFTRFLELSTESTYLDPAVTYLAENPDQLGSVNGLEGMAYWLSAVNSPETDSFIEDSARNSLFEDSNGDALDLAALNIQRGRDHGIPSYSEYRSFCGLSQPSREWGDGLGDHTQDVVEALKKVYASPQDIDLFTGLITETLVSGGSVGPTLDCILGDQFMKLKFGDRFWYQGRVNGFKPAQQAEIQKASMARILCDNFDFEKVHVNAFINQNLVSCSDIQSMDLKKFVPNSRGGSGGDGTRPTGTNRFAGSREGQPRDVENLMEQLLEELNNLE